MFNYECQNVQRYIIIMIPGTKKVTLNEFFIFLWRN